MGHLFRNYTNLKKKQKIMYFSPKVWRSIFFITRKPMFMFAEKKVWARNSTIPHLYCGEEILVHTGKKFKKRYVNRWMVGFKFGSFTWNRRYALYKSKRKKK